MKKWYGIRDIDYIYRGDYSDPLLDFHGFRMSEWCISDALYEEYKEYKHEYNDSGMDFTTYVQLNAVDYITDWLHTTYMDIDFIHENAPEYFELLRDSLLDERIETCDEYPDIPTDSEVLEHYSGTSFCLEDFVSASALKWGIK